MRNVLKIIDIFGGFDRLADHPICLHQPGYDRLAIELVGRGPSGWPLLSLAHYYEQNGDLMADPEMTFELAADYTFQPVSFKNHSLGVYQVARWRDDANRLMIRPKLLRDLRSFASTWNRNLGEQGWLDVARDAVRSLSGN